ncbi:voltage-dependent potassium channel beta subunit [Bacillus oleivorans]|uniref:Voltage-dependent potassium channel beta subunit n=1 Tax=Bacillus oleivorans TaxID=1448271 RepID=A0A285CSG5_9BACI|nr:aldo/keto reductase family protein [Bacillus oleivorans]SNX69893.1 voltage-dependent potassium channel beta subunit [Bacillus oleivorans]
MKFRKLGRTGLKVSEISLGSWLTYGSTVATDQSEKIIDTAYETGINFFDTANVYERGEAEIVVGKALKKYPRESYVLATKVFWPMGEGVNDRGLSRKHVYEQANASLKRLGLDYIDIYYCHRYDPETPIDETLRTIDDLVRQGKVLYVGVSEWTASQISEALRTSDKYLLDRIVVHQPAYNMFHRRIEAEVIPYSEQQGISQVVFSPLAQGLLTGKYKLGQPLPENSRATNEKINRSMQSLLKEENLVKVGKLDEVAKGLNISLSQLALAWILRQPNVASALIGATKPEHVLENVKAIDVTLSEDVLEEIEHILA